MTRDDELREALVEMYLKGQRDGFKVCARAFMRTMSEGVAQGLGAQDAAFAAALAIAKYASGEKVLDNSEMKEVALRALAEEPADG